MGVGIASTLVAPFAGTYFSRVAPTSAVQPPHSPLWIAARSKRGKFRPSSLTFFIPYENDNHLLCARLRPSCSPHPLYLFLAPPAHDTSAYHLLMFFRRAQE